MKNRYKGLVLAMEEVNDDESVDTSESVYEAENDMQEAEDQASEIGDLVSATDDAEDDVATMSSIKEVMEDSVEQGEGLNETAAEIAEVAVEAICARLGISNTRTMPATESFGSSNSRVTATKIAIESIGSKIMDILKAIKAAFIRAYEYIKEFLKKYLTAMGSAKRAAADLLKDVKAFDDKSQLKDDIKNGMLEDKGLAAAFCKDGKADGKTANAILLNQTSVTKAILKALGIVKEVASDLLANSGDVAKLSNLVGSDELDQKKQTFAKIMATPLQEQMVYSTTLTAKPSTIKGFIVEFFTESTETKVESIEVLDKAGLGMVLGAVSSLITESEAYNAESSKIDAIFNGIVKTTDGWIKIAAKMSDDASSKEFKDNLAEAKKSAESVRKIANTATSEIPKLNIRAIKAGLNYVSKSMKAYK